MLRTMCSVGGVVRCLRVPPEIKHRGSARRLHDDRRCFEQCAQFVACFDSCVSTPVIKNRGFARGSHADRRCFEQCAQLVVWFVACVPRPRLIIAAMHEGCMLIDDASSNVLNWWRGSFLVCQHPRLNIAASHGGLMQIDEASINVLRRDLFLA